MNIARAGSLLAIALVLCAVPIHDRITGADGPEKAFVQGVVRRLESEFVRAAAEIRIVTADEEWNTALAGWRPMKSLGICLDDARILIRATSGIFPTEHTINHEIGHAVWKKILSTRDRARILEIFRSDAAFPTKYSRRNEEEFFAEIFAIAASENVFHPLDEIFDIIAKYRRTR